MNEVESTIMIGNLFSENTTVLNFIEINNELKKYPWGTSSAW